MRYSPSVQAVLGLANWLLRTATILAAAILTLANPGIASVNFSSQGSFTITAVGVGNSPRYKMNRFYPLRAGAFWTYRYPDGSTYTMTVLPGTTDINGVATRAISDTDGFIQYSTNDSNGVRFHGQLNTRTGNWTIYSPPVQIFHPSQYVSQPAESFGTAHTNYGDFPYSSSFAFTSFETVTVPLRSFSTIRQDGRITIGGSPYTYTINYAPGVGIVKEVQTPYPQNGRIELIATNVNIKTPLDFDGDGMSDVATFGNREWSISYSTPPLWSQSIFCNFVLCPEALWTPVAADYDGDGKTDKAVYLNGAWGIVRSSDNQTTVIGFGGAGFEPVPADYDGDGKDDIAVYSDGVWSIMRSSDGANQVVAHGGQEWIPVAADYDGDGKADVAVYHPNGAWVIKRSSDGGSTVVGHGGPDWQPVRGDFDGDGIADIAVYSNGMWSILRSSDNGNMVISHGAPGRTPVAGDYDGDGKTDLVVYGNGEWLIRRSLDGGIHVVGHGGGPNSVPLK